MKEVSQILQMMLTMIPLHQTIFTEHLLRVFMSKSTAIRQISQRHCI